MFYVHNGSNENIYDKPTIDLGQENKSIYSYVPLVTVVWQW